MNSIRVSKTCVLLGFLAITFDFRKVIRRIWVLTSGVKLLEYRENNLLPVMSYGHTGR